LRRVQTTGGKPAGVVGVPSSDRNNRAPILVEEHQWGLKSALPAEEHQQGIGGWVWSAEANTQATIQTKECQWQLHSTHPMLRSMEKKV